MNGTSGHRPLARPGSAPAGSRIRRSLRALYSADWTTQKDAGPKTGNRTSVSHRLFGRETISEEKKAEAPAAAEEPVDLLAMGDAIAGVERMSIKGIG